MLLIMYFSEYQFLKGVHKNVSTSLKTYYLRQYSSTSSGDTKTTDTARKTPRSMSQSYGVITICASQEDLLRCIYF